MNGTTRSFALSGLVAALMMMWPVVYNGYPLLYPDSMSYLRQGAPVARALFLRNFAGYYGGRSLIYSVGILPFHWNVTAWPVVVLNAFVTAYILWLVVRSLLPERMPQAYFVLVGLLSLVTGLGWFVGWIMPDLFGPVLYLAIYLLVFAPETLSRAERRAVVLIAGWSVASHITHLMLAVGLCVLFLTVLAVRRQLTRKALGPVGTVAMITFFAAAAQVALHTYLYGEPSLNGQRPPFVLARMIADGPGRWYLQQHCPTLHVTICAHSQDLPDNVDAFLCSATSIWQRASPAEQERIRNEEAQIVLGTLRAYPREELSVSAEHSGNSSTRLTCRIMTRIHGSSRWWTLCCPALGHDTCRRARRVRPCMTSSSVRCSTGRWSDRSVRILTLAVSFCVDHPGGRHETERHAARNRDRFGRDKRRRICPGEDRALRRFE